MTVRGVIHITCMGDDGFATQAVVIQEVGEIKGDVMTDLLNEVKRHIEGLYDIVIDTKPETQDDTEATD
jgi:hypothetical protein